MLECESEKDFTNASEEEILQEKQMLIEQIKELDIEFGSSCDIKKAYELIKLKGML